MSVAYCPVCGNAEDVPTPEWAEDDTETEEVCPSCELDWYGDDESRVP